jgi:hypothetical protein
MLLKFLLPISLLLTVTLHAQTSVPLPAPGTARIMDRDGALHQLAFSEPKGCPWRNSRRS